MGTLTFEQWLETVDVEGIQHGGIQETLRTAFAAGQENPPFTLTHPEENTSRYVILSSESLVSLQEQCNGYARDGFQLTGPVGTVLVPGPFPASMPTVVYTATLVWWGPKSKVPAGL